MPQVFGTPELTGSLSFLAWLVLTPSIGPEYGSPPGSATIPGVAAMRWTRDEIARHADRLADRFEDFDPAEAIEVPVAEYLLARAVRERDRSEQEVTKAVGTPGAHIEPRSDLV